jgi:hypothetical protein
MENISCHVVVPIDRESKRSKIDNGEWIIEYWDSGSPVATQVP